MPDQSERDWKEDFSHENGKYQNECGKCHQLFYGHKRRVRCKVCQEEPAQPEAPKEGIEKAEQYAQWATGNDGKKLIHDSPMELRVRAARLGYLQGVYEERKSNPQSSQQELIAELWSLWESMDESGELFITSDYERLKKEVETLTRK